VSWSHLVIHVTPFLDTEVEVLYSYEPKEQDELKLSVGDIIRKVVPQEAGWFSGTGLNGDTGVFPDNFVRVSKNYLILAIISFLVSHIEVFKPTVSTNSISISTGIEPGTDIAVD